MQTEMYKFYLNASEFKRCAEDSLTDVELLSLYEMCNKYSEEQIKELVNIYNNKPDRLSRAERVFLLNYICKKEATYNLYYVNGKKIIMETKGNTNKVDEEFFTEPKSDRINKCMKLVKKYLIENEFIILEDSNEFLAFNKARNIVYYIPVVSDFNDSKEFYMQPTQSVSGKIMISRFKTLNSCNDVFCEFPIFDESNFLNLYSYACDNGDDEYYISMKKIHKYKELFNSVGISNQETINSIVNSILIRYLNKIN